MALKMLPCVGGGGSNWPAACSAASMAQAAQSPAGRILLVQAARLCGAAGLFSPIYQYLSVDAVCNVAVALAGSLWRLAAPWPLSSRPCQFQVPATGNFLQATTSFLVSNCLAPYILIYRICRSHT